MICRSIAQIGRVLRVIEARTCLIARDLLARLQQKIELGRGQVVRHRFLVSCIVGSNPTAPANSHKRCQYVPLKMLDDDPTNDLAVLRMEFGGDKGTVAVTRAIAKSCHSI